MQLLEAPAAIHELDGQPVEQFRMAGRVALSAEFLRRGDDPRAEIRLPDAVHGRPRGRRGLPIDEPARERQPRRAASSGSVLRNAGTPGVTALTGLRKSPRIKTLVVRGVSRRQNELGRAFGMRFPQRLNAVVGVFPFGDGRPPVAEQRCVLRNGAEFFLDT